MARMACDPTLMSVDDDVVAALASKTGLDLDDHKRAQAASDPDMTLPGGTDDGDGGDDDDDDDDDDFTNEFEGQEVAPAEVERHRMRLLDAVVAFALQHGFTTFQALALELLNLEFTLQPAPFRGHYSRLLAHLVEGVHGSLPIDDSNAGE